MKDFRGESRRPFDRVIGASRIGDDDFIDHGSDTTESVLDPIFFILNDHAQRDSHYAQKQSTSGAKEKGRGKRGTTRETPFSCLFLDIGNFCLMPGTSCPIR
jgi:hypothetical protein